MGMKGNIKLDVNELASGHYLLQLSNSQERVMKKFVVVK
jgi:hypothetical protein